MELLDLYHHPYTRPLSVAVSSIACILISIYFLEIGYTIIFQNLFYVPIILVCAIYIWRGLIFSCFLILTYFGLMVVYITDPATIMEALIRVVIFIGIAGVVTFFALINQKSKDEIRQLAAFRESIINNARVWLTVLNKKGEILLWNTAAEEITGYKLDVVLGNNAIWKLLYPKKEYRKEITDTITRIISENQFLENFETTILTKDGKQRFISWNTKEIPSDSKGEPSFVAIGIDITDRKCMEESLKETNTYLENLISIANVPIIIWDSQFRISRMNHAFENLIGRTEEEVLGKSIEFMFPVQDVQQSMNLLKTTQEGVRWDTVEIDIQHKDGSVRNLVWNSATLYNFYNHRPVATIAQGLDVTEMHQYEIEQNRSMGQIQKNMAQLAVLNDGIRNPLTVIMSIAETYLEDRTYYQIIKQADKINDIVTQLDQRWVESEAVLKVLRKHYDIFISPQMRSENSKCDDIGYI